ncbi:MAG: hypothetical protein WC544_01150 [Patescibacteria group bacterium]
MYITNWDFAKYNYGETVTVNCIDAPPADAYTNKQSATYTVGQSYTAQRMKPFGDGWIVALHSHGGLHDGFDFSPEDFARYFKITAKHPATVA